MPSKTSLGLINAEEAYSKRTVLDRLGVSQKVWDQMLDAGLPFTPVGHPRWATGKALIEHLTRHAMQKHTA